MSELLCNTWCATPLGAEPPLGRGWAIATTLVYLAIASGFILYNIYVLTPSVSFEEVAWWSFWIIIGGMGDAALRSSYKKRTSLAGMLCLVSFGLARRVLDVQVTYARTIAFWIVTVASLAFLAAYFYYSFLKPKPKKSSV